MPEPWPMKKLSDYPLSRVLASSATAAATASIDTSSSTSTSTSTGRGGVAEEEAQAEEEQEDGMSKCLRHLRLMTDSLQAAVDEELSLRLQHRNTFTVSLLWDMTEYKRSLLHFLANSDAALVNIDDEKMMMMMSDFVV